MKPRLILALVIAISFLLVFGGTAKATPIAHLTLQGQPGDFIAGGLNFDFTYTPLNSQLFAAQIRRTIPSGPAEIDFILGTVTSGSNNTFATLFFGTDQLGIPMQPGVYLNAQRADFAAPGHPGLDVGFQNRGCNTLTGNFTVQTAQFILGGPGGTAVVDRFAATFEQHCEGATPALFGSFFFDSDPTRIPEPASIVLAGAALFLFAFVKRPSANKPMLR
jgi:hypothetical protein